MKELRTWTSVLIVHLKGSEGQVKEYFIIFCDGFTEWDEDHVVDPEQGDQQQSGLGQPPERNSNEEFTLPGSDFCFDVCFNFVEMTITQIQIDQRTIKPAPKCSEHCGSTMDEKTNNKISLHSSRYVFWWKKQKKKRFFLWMWWCFDSNGSIRTCQISKCGQMKQKPSARLLEKGLRKLNTSKLHLCNNTFHVLSLKDGQNLPLSITLQLSTLLSLAQKYAECTEYSRALTGVPPGRGFTPPPTLLKRVHHEKL